MPRTTHAAPYGRYRLLAVDRDTGEEAVEMDFWQEYDAHDYIHDHEDDRPWIQWYVYDDQGRELNGRD